MILRILSKLGVLALVVAWFVLLRPVPLGGPASYEVVVGTSMEPILHTGDLVIAQAASSYSVGDLIVYRVPSGQPAAGSLIVHRIVGGDATRGFVVQGDNKRSPDVWRPRLNDIVGRSWIQLPGSGKLLLVLRQPLVLSALLGGLAALTVFYSGSSKSRTPPSGGSQTASADG